MNHPERGAQQGNILNENALAQVHVNQLWAQTICLGEAALVQGNTILSILHQTGTGSIGLVGRHTLLPAKLLMTYPRPPGLARATTVDGALAGDGDICLLVGIDQG